MTKTPELQQMVAQLNYAVWHYRACRDDYEIRLPRSYAASKDDGTPWLNVGHLRLALRTLKEQSNASE